MKIIAVITVLALSMIGSEGRAEESCQTYPNTEGINIEDVSGGTKIVSTAAAEVSFDDVSSVQDARIEATLEAKSKISQFLAEGIKSDYAVSQAVEETKTMQGSSKTTLRKEIKDRIKHLSSSSSSMLRGAVPLGECYTPGKELRVSVGLKPETIQAAGSLSDQISGTLSGQDTSQSTAASQQLNGVSGFSHTDPLKKF